MDCGIELMKELAERIRAFKLFNRSHELGRKPTSRLYPNSNDSKLTLAHEENPLMNSVSSPLMLFRERVSVFKLQSFPKFPDKWPPIMKFSDKSMCWRQVKVANSFGRPPRRLLDLRLRSTRLVKLNNQLGMEELKPLLDRSRTEREVRLTDGREEGRLES